MKSTRIVRTILLSIYLILVTSVSFARMQDCDPINPDCEPTDLPLDGGVGFLVAAGIGYGIKKIYQKKPGDQ